MATFNTWIDTLVEEKGLDTGMILEAEGNSGTNYIPLECVLDAIKQAPRNEQQAIKHTLVKIDFYNGDICHFFKHLAGALAI